MTTRISRIGRAALLALALLSVGAGPRIPAAQEAPSALLVTWETADDSTFRAVVTDPVSIARVQAAFPGDGQAGIPAGQLAAGDGGVNAPHAWHLTNVEVVDATIDLCDGLPSHVDADLDE